MTRTSRARTRRERWSRSQDIECDRIVAYHLAINTELLCHNCCLNKINLFERRKVIPFILFY